MVFGIGAFLVLVFAGFIVGMLFGYYKSKKRGGNRNDFIHQALVYGIAFGLLAWFLTLIIGWFIAY